MRKEGSREGGNREGRKGIRKEGRKSLGRCSGIKMTKTAKLLIWGRKVFIGLGRKPVTSKLICLGKKNQEKWEM